MPTTRAARAAATQAAAVELLGLPADVLGLVLYQLPLAHNIALTGLTCRALCDAAKLALKLRPFSGEVVTLGAHTNVQSVALGADNHIITCSLDRTLKIWRCRACVRTKYAHDNGIWSVKALPDGRFLTGSIDRTVKLWQPNGTLERTFAIENVAICIAVLPDGVHFVVGTGNGHLQPGGVRLYNVDGTLIHNFQGHTKAVWAVAATRDGKHFISGSEDGVINVWIIATKSLLITSMRHTDRVYAIAEMPDGQRIVSGGGPFEKTIRVWRLDGTLENIFHEVERYGVYCLTPMPDNQHVLYGTFRAVKLFNVNDGVALRAFTYHTNAVRCLALLPDGLRFVSGSDDKTVRIVYHGLAPAR